MAEFYLGNPNLKKANTPVEFTAEDIKEFKKCERNPVYFIYLSGYNKELYLGTRVV